MEYTNEKSTVDGCRLSVSTWMGGRFQFTQSYGEEDTAASRITYVDQIYYRGLNTALRHSSETCGDANPSRR